MPSSDPVQRFQDILDNVARIEGYMAGIDDSTAFEESDLVHDAVERCLERISEAAKKLGPAAEKLSPAFAGREFAASETCCGTNTIE